MSNPTNNNSSNDVSATRHFKLEVEGLGRSPDRDKNALEQFLRLKLQAALGGMEEPNGLHWEGFKWGVFWLNSGIVQVDGALSDHLHRVCTRHKAKFQKWSVGELTLESRSKSGLPPRRDFKITLLWINPSYPAVDIHDPKRFTFTVLFREETQGGDGGYNSSSEKVNDLAYQAWSAALSGCLGWQDHNGEKPVRVLNFPDSTLNVPMRISISSEYLIGWGSTNNIMEIFSTDGAPHLQKGSAPWKTRHDLKYKLEINDTKFEISIRSPYDVPVKGNQTYRAAAQTGANFSFLRNESKVGFHQLNLRMDKMASDISNILTSLKLVQQVVTGGAAAPASGTRPPPAVPRGSSVSSGDGFTKVSPRRPGSLAAPRVVITPEAVRKRSSVGSDGNPFASLPPVSSSGDFSPPMAARLRSRKGHASTKRRDKGKAPASITGTGPPPVTTAAPSPRGVLSNSAPHGSGSSAQDSNPPAAPTTRGSRGSTVATSGGSTSRGLPPPPSRTLGPSSKSTPLSATSSGDGVPNNTHTLSPSRPASRPPPPSPDTSTQVLDFESIPPCPLAGAHNQGSQSDDTGWLSEALSPEPPGGSDDDRPPDGDPLPPDPPPRRSKRARRPPRTYGH